MVLSIMTVPMLGLLVCGLAMLGGVIWTLTKHKSGHHLLLCLFGNHFNFSNEFTDSGATKSHHLCACCSKKTYLNYLSDE